MPQGDRSLFPEAPAVQVDSRCTSLGFKTLCVGFTSSPCAVDRHRCARQSPASWPDRACRSHGGFSCAHCTPCSGHWKRRFFFLTNRCFPGYITTQRKPTIGIRLVESDSSGYRSGYFPSHNSPWCNHHYSRSHGLDAGCRIGSLERTTGRGV
jgi:hypothetical protein